MVILYLVAFDIAKAAATAVCGSSTFKDTTLIFRTNTNLTLKQSHESSSKPPTGLHPHRNYQNSSNSTTPLLALALAVDLINQFTTHNTHPELGPRNPKLQHRSICLRRAQAELAGWITGEVALFCLLFGLGLLVALRRRRRQAGSKTLKTLAQVQTR